MRINSSDKIFPEAQYLKKEHTHTQKATYILAKYFPRLPKKLGVTEKAKNN